MKVVALISGGLDSAVMLAMIAKSRGTLDLKALSIQYNQRHGKRELFCATNLARWYRVEHTICDIKTSISGVIKGSCLTDPTIPVPEGHYEEESMKITVVPNRNMLFLAYAAAFAISNGMDTIAYAAHGGDHAIYPDCRPTFTMAMREALYHCHHSPISIKTPFLEPEVLTKADIVKKGSELGVPFGETWSCYKGGEDQCGKCGTCVERKEAFKLAGVTDPTRYLG